jgi:hypothetical protein
MLSMVINGVEYVEKKQTDISNIVCVRCRYSGVHIGELVEKNGEEVTLINSRQIWRWKGANTLKELCETGVDSSSYTRISETKTTQTILLDAISIDQVTENALKTLCAVWNN